MHFAGVVREPFGDSVIDFRLFVSHTRSTAHEESDGGTAVVLYEADSETRCDIIDLAADIGLERGLTLSPTGSTGRPPRAEASRTGRWASPASMQGIRLRPGKAAQESSDEELSFAEEEESRLRGRFRRRLGRLPTRNFRLRRRSRVPPSLSCKQGLRVFRLHESPDLPTDCSMPAWVGRSV